MDLKNLDNIKVPERELEDLKEKLYRENKKKFRSFRYSYVAASLAFIFTLGMAFPKYTKDLPVYSNIFSLFGDEGYQNASKKVDEEVYSNGVSIRLVDVVYSNNEVSLTTIIKTDKYLGEEVYLQSDLSFKNTVEKGSTGSEAVKYMGNNTYISETKSNIDFLKKVDPLKIKFKVRKIANYKTGEEISGKWNFVAEVENLKADTYILNQRQEIDGVVVNIDRVDIDDVGPNFKLSWWNNLDLPATIHNISNTFLIDEMGNEIEIESKGLMGDEKIMHSEFKSGKNIDLNKNYVLKFELNSSDEIGYNEKGEIERYELKNRAAFEKLPKKIVFEMPIELNK
ncbi:protein of unknown function [Peptoniphilus asaccharolyticus DSM 20463]|uniref:DUF4179 domain-containing protein n=1 Tax=Peptoniphilus asaccharolyticus DSM 20463 TaxID=573058 RepID=A0A1W1V3N6_PEPAS|nr:DUF4179 domain-containing protein [Peptoniphilus asaccharolyticus]MBL7576236.1 DUF4179 domain-containing protein [Peptoniphilus asaccharolyticus]SMB87900.1 protein of unknown function [Peptoniphilus asaccharolyticus DSM 20463]